MKKRFCAGLAISLLLLASNWAYATNEVEVYRNGNGSIAVKLFEPSTLNDSPVPFIVRSPEGQFEPESGRVLISKSHSDGVWAATNINTAYTFVAKSPSLQKGESSYVVCWGKWIVPKSETQQNKKKTEKIIDTWKAELLESGTRVFVIYKYDFEMPNIFKLTQYGINSLVKKMPKQGKNIIVTCGNAADIDNIDKLGSYLERKYDIHQKQISYLLLCGHGVRHRISQSYYAYSLAVPYLKCPPHDGLGFVGDLFDPPRSNNGLCQQSTEDYVKCFANLLKDEAIVTLQSCSSSTKYDVDMPLLGTASMAKRVKYYLNQNGGLFNVIGISGISAYYPEQGAWFTNYDIPFRPNYTGGYGAGEE